MSAPASTAAANELAPMPHSGYTRPTAIAVGFNAGSATITRPVTIHPPARFMMAVPVQSRATESAESSRATTVVIGTRKFSVNSSLPASVSAMKPIPNASAPSSGSPVSWRTTSMAKTPSPTSAPPTIPVASSDGHERWRRRSPSSTERLSVSSSASDGSTGRSCSPDDSFATATVYPLPRDLTLAPVGDEPSAVDGRELVEVPAPVVEPVDGEEEVIGAGARRGLAQHVDLRGRREVAHERHAPARDPLLRRRHHDGTALRGHRRPPARHHRRHERVDGLATFVSTAARLHDAVGREDLDHVVDAPAVAVGVVPGDAVANALARDELPHFHGRTSGQPSAAGSTNHTTRSASTWAAGRSSPARTRASASRLSSPATVNTTRRARARAGKVNVSRGCGCRSSPLGTTRRSSTASAGVPGNSDAVWPSGPSPRCTRSIGGTPATSASYAAAAASMLSAAWR